MAINIKDTAKVGHVGNAFKRAMDATNSSFKSLSVANNTVNFYNTTDSTGSVAASFAIPGNVSVNAASDGLEILSNGTMIFKIPVM